jgi:bifunctional DNA-binding transcriptional regulator/antitoxin component of YhaV-PrlF toxin-antitoxin module
VVIRKKLGVGPGSGLEWDQRDSEVVVRRVGAHSSADIHGALLDSAKPTPVSDIKGATRKHMREKHARR